MNDIKKSVLFILVIFLHQFAFPTENDWIKQSIDFTINTKFEQAESLLMNKLNTGDTTLQVYFYYASVLNSKMTHFENQLNESEFVGALQAVIRKTNQQLENSENIDSSEIANLFFYRGSAIGYLAYYQGQTGEWYQAIDNGLQSVSDLNRAIEFDSTLFDAYLGIGVYQYWRSTKLKYILWLPFISDVREEGISNIKKAIEGGKYSRYLGMHQLIYILLDYRYFGEVEKYARHVVQAYPESQFMWWANAHTYYKMKNFPLAIQSYKHLLRLIEKDKNANQMHWLACHVKLAEIYYKTGESQSCINHCNLALNRTYPVIITKKGQEKLKQARELLIKSQTGLTKINNGSL